MDVAHGSRKSRYYHPNNDGEENACETSNLVAPRIWISSPSLQSQETLDRFHYLLFIGFFF